MTEMHPGDREYLSQTLSLPSLFVTNDVLSDVRFVNCLLTGPAVMFLLGDVTMSGCGFDGDFEAVIWRIEREQERIIGAVGFQRCEFYNCRFQRVGIAVPPDMRGQIKAGFGLS